MSRKQEGMSAAELSSFCGQVALILEAGLPLYDGMETLAKSGAAEDGDMIQRASQAVTETGRLYDALQQDERWPSYMTEMTGIGERSGHLEQVMRGLERYYAREDRIRSAIVSAITYPLVLGVMLVLIVGVLLLKVMPVFRRVLSSMGVAMSESGLRMMRLGTAVGWIVAIAVLILIVGVLVLVLLSRTGHREKVLALVQKLFPTIGRLNQTLSASRVSGVLAMMLSSGFPTGEALQMASSVISDREAAEKLQKVQDGLDRGESFADAVTEAQIFESLHSSMIRMGSATGHEDQVFEKLAELYENQAEEEINRLIAIIEPTLVALLAVIIGAVLLAVLLPMAGILSSL